MARSNTSLMPNEQNNLLEDTDLSEVTVTLETTPCTSEMILQENSSPNNDSSCLLMTNPSSLNHSPVPEEKIISNTPVVQGSLVGRDQLMNEGSTIHMNNAEMLNLIISQRKQQEQLKHAKQEPTGYSCTIQSNNVSLNSAPQEQTKTEPEEENGECKSMVTTSTAEQRPGYYIGNTEIQSQLASGYEVTTFVTEDGQTGQIIISGNGTYPDLSSNGIVSLGDTNITTITSDGQVLSLGEDAMEQLAGLENFAGGQIQLATTQGADGTTQFQYVLKQETNTKDEQEYAVPPVKKVFQCNIDNCSKQFSTPYRLKAHGRSHSGDTFTCISCNKTFVTTGDLQKHTKTHLGQKEFICEVEGCKKEYTTAHHLKVHRRQHSGERPFACEWEGCGKMFTTGYGLKSHFRTHTNERPYKCQESTCTKSFKTSGDLQKHVRTHTGERPFVCPYKDCGRSFTTSNIRKVHLRTHTGEKPYRCEIEGCGRTFASATNYKNHSRIHTGERPYVCEVPGCLKRFTEYSSLYKHNIVHTQQKPYTCALCNKTYRQTSTLAMHKRTVHGTEDITETETQNTILMPTVKRQKLSQTSQHLPSSNGYLQGMSLVINNTSGSNDQFTAELSAQHLPEASEIPGAIAIPIQVTMNADGTIAGAQGLNLTDGSGRMIPVNLSVSIPMSLTQINDNNTDDGDPCVDQSAETIYSESNNPVINMLAERDVTPRQSSSAPPSEHGDAHGQLTSSLMNSSSAPELMVTRLSDENFDVDPDEGDVTDKYLTSHYRKDVRNT